MLSEHRGWWRLVEAVQRHPKFVFQNQFAFQIESSPKQILSCALISELIKVFNIKVHFKENFIKDNLLGGRLKMIAADKWKHSSFKLHMNLKISPRR